MYNIGVGLVLGIEYFWPPTIIYQYQHLGIGIPPKDPTYSSSFVGNHMVCFALNANICNRVSVMSAFGMVLHWIFDDWSWIEKQMSILYREVWWIVIRLKIPNSLADTANARAGSKTDLFYRGSLTSLTTSGSSSPASASPFWHFGTRVSSKTERYLMCSYSQLSWLVFVSWFQRHKLLCQAIQSTIPSFCLKKCEKYKRFSNWYKGK